MDKYYVFTDGASKNNQSKDRKGSYAVYFPENPELNISKVLDGKQTNNAGELSAIYYGIIKLVTNVNVEKEIVVISDSMYSINCITKWSKNWEKNNWKKSDGKEIQNKSLIKKIYYLVKNLNIKFQHQKAHKTSPKDKDSIEYFLWKGNFMADQLANEALGY